MLFIIVLRLIKMNVLKTIRVKNWKNNFFSILYCYNN